MSQPLLMMQRSTNPGKSPAVTGSEGQKYPLADAGRTHVGFVSGFTQKWAHDSFVVAVAAHREDSIDFAWIRKVRVGQEVQQTEHVVWDLGLWAFCPSASEHAGQQHICCVRPDKMQSPGSTRGKNLKLAWH